MKKLLIILFILQVNFINAQSQFSESSITDFFKNRGVKLLKEWGHPRYYKKVKDVIITIENNTVIISLSYKGRISDFVTIYKIALNINGYFESIDVEDGNLITPAFEVCDIIRENMANLLEKDARKGKGEIKNKIEILMGKTANFFTCKDWCLFTLNYYWIKDGYYSENS